MRKHFKKILSFGLSLSIILGLIVTPTASTDVEVKVQNTPKIDIMLTSKNTNLDLSNFETDVKTKLKQLGVSTNDINFTTIERVTTSFDQDSASPTEIMNSWDQYPNPNAYIVYGNYILNNALGGNSFPVGSIRSFNQVFIKDNTYDSDDLSISADINIHHCEFSSGLVVKYDPTTDIAYLALANNCQRTGYKYCKSITLVKATNFKSYLGVYPTYKVVENQATVLASAASSNFGIPYIASGCADLANTSTTFNMKAEYIDKTGTINVYVNGKLAISHYVGDIVGGPGLYAGCNAAFQNVMVESTSESIKTYKEVLTEPTWRDNAKHIVVNVDNNIDDTLTSTSTIGEILSRTLADDIHFIQWGTDTNKSATTNFIKQNDNKGLFTYNSDYSKAIEDTANYIKTLVGYEEAEEQYITIGQEINLSVTPENFKTGATSTDYPNGRWKVNHEYKYFANNLGQSSDAGMYTPNLTCAFNKPGKYEITFDDEVVKTIYVHRKPVADFEINIENLVLELKSTSSDLDSDTNNGIASEKWYYKEASASEWMEGKLTQLDKTKIYVIKLEVEDFQGATSYTTKYVGTGNPVSKFTFTNDTVCKYNKLEINNTSYDPIGYDISNESWVLKKEGEVIGTYTTPILDFNTANLGSGNYSYTLTVANSAGTKSEAYTKSFTIVDDVAKPEIAVDTDVNNTWLPEKEVDVEISDNESNVSKWRYEFVTSPTPTIEDNEWSNWETEKTEMTINSGALSGRYYLHIQAYDSANNLTERTIGPFNLDNTNPVINGVNVEKQGFRDNKVTIHAFDEHSGIVGYALTKYEPTTFDMRARTFAAVKTPEFQESNEFKVESDGLYTAWVIDELGNIETSVCEITNSNQTDKTTTVYAEIGSEFKVTIPKKIVLSGTTKSGTYTVTVEGDIAGLEVISVTPDSAVTLSSKDKADVIGTITQDKLNWTYSEIYTDSKILANGSISASGITAGAWNGTFNFAIKLENNGKYTNSEWSVEYQDVTFDMEELDNSEVTE